MSARALRGNYAAIRAQVRGLKLIPMIKANAYGHGAPWAARALVGLPDLYALGVATLEEGAELRQVLGKSRAPIMVFSGAGPWSEAKGQFCERQGLIPVISSDQDWTNFLSGGWPGRLPYHLKFNTGMNRLGLSAASARAVVAALRRKPQSWSPQGVLSHLAMGEAPEHRTSRTQLERFQAIQAGLSGAFAGTIFHLANSAAIWKAKAWKLRELTSVARFGISLYGVPPWPTAPGRGLRAVLRLRAQVIAVHALEPGESLGYGATFTARRREPIAVLAAGYADGVHRYLSNRGSVLLDGRKVKLLGRVSMDLSACACPPGVRPGDWAEFLGPEIDPWEQARAAESVPYELFTSISPRVERRHER